jgi:hypothetical protein
MMACGSPPSPVDVRAQVDLAPHPPVDIRILLRPEHASDAARYVEAASSAVRECASALGGFDVRKMTLADPLWHGPPPDSDAVTLDRVHWWTTATSMEPELAAARGVSRRCWTSAIDSDALPPWFVDGLAEFTARRAVVPIFERENTSPGYAFLEERFFAGFVPRFVRIRLLIETDGAPVSAYRANATADVEPRSPSAGDREALAGKTLLALGTLERWVGRPVFDEIVAEFARASKGRAPQLADFERVASDVSGQELSWFFDQAFRSSYAFDYGVEALASVPDAGGGFVTAVTARRYGEARFTGASGTRTGGFDLGRGITLRVVFADGQQRTDWWDGRDERRTFRYRSPGRAESATIDPDRVLLLDLHQTNNSRTLAPRQSAAATRWASLYLLWLEHLLLSYTSLA